MYKYEFPHKTYTLEEPLCNPFLTTEYVMPDWSQWTEHEMNMFYILAKSPSRLWKIERDDYSSKEFSCETLDLECWVRLVNDHRYHVELFHRSAYWNCEWKSPLECRLLKEDTGKQVVIMAYVIREMNLKRVVRAKIPRINRDGYLNNLNNYAKSLTKRGNLNDHTITTETK